MRNKKRENVWILTLIFCLYLSYQSYNLFLDIKYRLLDVIEFDVFSLIFLLFSIIGVVISAILILKLYKVKKDSILWLNRLFIFSLFETLVSTIYFVTIDFSPFNLNYTFLLIRILCLLGVIMVFWILSSIYLKKKLKWFEIVYVRVL